MVTSIVFDAPRSPRNRRKYEHLIFLKKLES